jgi:hypothetical protein
VLTRGALSANGKVPRGPISGCHVAPRVLPILATSKVCWGSGGSNPGPPSMQCLNRFTLSMLPRFGACYVIRKLCIYVNVLCYGKKGAGRGLSPDPGFIVPPYDRWRGTSARFNCWLPPL